MKRYWEIDSLRGIAIIMMIIFHIFFDLVYFGILSFDIFKGFWWFFARFIAMLFIFLVGVSLTLSYSRVKNIKTRKEIVEKYLFRGIKLFAWGLLITLITWIFLREKFVLFGVLHLIGISIILAYPLLKYRFLNLCFGLSVLFLGLYLGKFRFDFSWLLWLGFRPRGYYPADYEPIFPWFGWVLLGLFFANLLYKEGIRRFELKNLSNLNAIKGLSFLGRNSLFIYLIHRPLVFGAVYLIYEIIINI